MKETPVIKLIRLKKSYYHFPKKKKSYAKRLTLCLVVKRETKLKKP